MHHERRNMNENKSNDLQTIITQVIEEMKYEQGHKFDLNKINESISKQQANELRISNIENRRIELQKVLGYENMTFKEIIETFDDKKEVNELYRRISTTVHDIQFFNQRL